MLSYVIAITKYPQKVNGAFLSTKRSLWPFECAPFRRSLIFKVYTNPKSHDATNLIQAAHILPHDLLKLLISMLQFIAQKYIPGLLSAPPSGGVTVSSLTYFKSTIFKV